MIFGGLISNDLVIERPLDMPSGIVNYLDTAESQLDDLPLRVDLSTETLSEVIDTDRDVIILGEIPKDINVSLNIKTSESIRIDSTWIPENSNLSSKEEIILLNLIEFPSSGFLISKKIISPNVIKHKSASDLNIVTSDLTINYDSLYRSFITAKLVIGIINRVKDLNYFSQDSISGYSGKYQNEVISGNNIGLRYFVTADNYRYCTISDYFHSRVFEVCEKLTDNILIVSNYFPRDSSLELFKLDTYNKTLIKL